ncbi:MAG TPA: TIR domain-containing protein, partial [Mycobacteriales bacterium]|nr:TIR domain-containing protein [Mycobacteriales bacterium]
HVLEVVREGFALAAAVVVLLTPDDFAVLHESLWQSGDLPHERVLTGQPRANVLFEAGMAMALHPERTVLVQVGPVRAFSDTAGLDFVQIDGSTVKLKNIAQRLARAGCRVDTRGDGWLDESRFAGLAALGRAS